MLNRCLQDSVGKRPSRQELGRGRAHLAFESFLHILKPKALGNEDRGRGIGNR